MFQICHDFKLLITEEKYQAIATNIETFTRAVEDLMGEKNEVGCIVPTGILF